MVSILSPVAKAILYLFDAESHEALLTPATSTTPAESIWPCALTVNTGMAVEEP